MLYVTTAVEQDTFTAHRTLTNDYSPEGGLFVPLRLPRFSPEELADFASDSFGCNMAKILNIFFGTKLDGWSVDFCIGRAPAKLVSLGGKVAVAELWHNPHWKFSRFPKNLQKILMEQPRPIPSPWLRIAARIGALFGLYRDLTASRICGQDGTFDVAVSSGDFSGAMAVWYAREMGLPVANLICCCNENSGLWNLLHQGMLRTDVTPVKTTTPDCDRAVPPELERLIYAQLGLRENLCYRAACEQGSTYYLEESLQEQLRQGIQVRVVSRERVDSMISNLYKTARYIPDPYTALAYSGLLDYRSATGESRPAVILSEYSPAHFLDSVSRGLGITPMELKRWIEKG